MKKLFIFLYVISFMFLFSEAGAQTITTEIGDYEVVIGDTLEVSIVANNFYNIASVSLALQYDTNILSYIGYGNINPAMFYGTFIVGANNDEIRIAWFSLFPGSFGNDTMLNLTFSGRALGTTTLKWDTLSSGNCEFTGINGIPLPDYYVSGGVFVEPPALGFRGKVFLQGAYASASMMNTNLFSLGSFPLSQPFDTLPWNYTGTEQIDSATAGIVDWILIELRDSSDAATVVERRAALLLQDGTIADTNLLDELVLQSIGSYYIAIKHSNHLPVMTATPMPLPERDPYDFSDTSNFPVYNNGSSCVISLGDTNAGMIAGDINQDGLLKYSGPQNDKGLILQKIVSETGSTSITSTAGGYFREDLNMNGILKYSGPQNDPSIIIQNLVNLNGTTSITSFYSTPVPAAVIP